MGRKCFRQTAAHFIYAKIGQLHRMRGRIGAAFDFAHAEMPCSVWNETNSLRSNSEILIKIATLIGTHRGAVCVCVDR